MSHFRTIRNFTNDIEILAFVQSVVVLVGKSLECHEDIWELFANDVGDRCKMSLHVLMLLPFEGAVKDHSLKAPLV